MKKLIYILTITLFCVTGCLSRTSSYQTNFDFSQIDKIAILSVDGQVQSEEAKGQISNLFVIELLNKGYAPIPLAQCEAKLRSIAESNSPAQNDYEKIGEILEVPALLLVDIPVLDNDIFISAQLINSKNGSVLWMNQSSGDNEGEEIAFGDRRGKNQEDYLMDPRLMFQEPPGAPKTQEAAAQKAGNQPLTPRELRKIETIVSRVCKNLPPAVSPTLAKKPLTKTPKPKSSSDW